MPLDPTFRTVLDALDAAGAMPLVRGDALETRARYRELSLSRRGPDFVPEPVAAVENSTVPGPSGEVAVRIYHPLQDRGRVVVYLHGGGWVVGDLDTHDPVCRRVATAVGAVVVAVDYRLAPEHPYPAALDDAHAALRAAAERLPGRPLGVAGDSAGASLAAGLALRARDHGPAVAAQLLFYPAVDPAMTSPSVSQNGAGYFLTGHDMRWFYAQYLPDGVRDREVDLLHADVHGVAPAVVATAEFDPLRDEGQAYVAHLQDADVPVTHVPGPGLIHGYVAFVGMVAAAERAGADALARFGALLDR